MTRDELLKAVAKSVASLAQNIAALQPDVKNVKDTSARLAASVVAELGDGSDITADELHSEAMQIISVADQVIDRDSDKVTE